MPGTSDLISRQTAIHTITSYNGTVDKSVAKRVLIQLPSAQPEIVHCKDCRFVIDEGDGYTCGNSTSWVVGTDAEFGCVLAERRTDG